MVAVLYTLPNTPNMADICCSILSNATLLAYGLMLHCWLMVQCYTAGLWSNATLLAYGPMLHCWLMVHCYTAGLWSNATLLAYGPMLHCWLMVQCLKKKPVAEVETFDSIITIPVAAHFMKRELGQLTR